MDDATILKRNLGEQTQERGRDDFPRLRIGDDGELAGTHVVREDELRESSTGIERQMKWFYQSLSEQDRRREAAIEDEPLGFGGVESVSQLLGCDPQTIRQGRGDLPQPEDSVPDRVRKKLARR